MAGSTLDSRPKNLAGCSPHLVVALVVHQLAAIHCHDARSDAAQEVAVVGDSNHRACRGWASERQAWAASVTTRLWLGRSSEEGHRL